MVECADNPGLLTEADLRKKLMKSMKPFSKHLSNYFAVGAVILTCLVLLAGCKGGGGGGKFKDICEDYCERAVVECLQIPRGEDLCFDSCIDDLEEAEDLDGNLCRDAQVRAFQCIIDLDDCQDVFDFAGLDLAAIPYPVCTQEVDDAINLCINSITLE